MWVYGDHSMGIVLLTCVRVMASVYLSHVFLSSSNTFFVSQVLGQLHGGRPRRFHERQPPQRYAHHHPAQEVHGAHTHHLSPGQEAQAGLPPAHGGGRGAGQPAGGGRTGWGSVPGVGRFRLSFSLCCDEFAVFGRPGDKSKRIFSDIGLKYHESENGYRFPVLQLTSNYH